MSNVDMGGSIKGNKNKKNRLSQKNQNKDSDTQKMIYLNIPTSLTFIIELYDTPVADKYAKAMANSITQAFKPDQIKLMIFELFGVNNEKEIKEKRFKEYSVLTRVFGELIWVN